MSSDGYDLDYDSVNEDFIHEFNINQLSPDKVDIVKCDNTFKALKITNCPGASDLIEKFKNNDFSSILQESTNFFLISIECQGNLKAIKKDELKVLFPLVGLERPLIIQLRVSSYHGENVIYYKEENCLEFRKINFVPKIAEEAALTRLSSGRDCDLLLLLRILKSKLFGYYENDLLDIKFKKGRERNLLTKSFSNNALCLRLLKMYEENVSYELSNQEVMSSLKKTNGVNSFLAMLDLPFQVNGEIFLNNEQRDLINDPIMMLRSIEHDNCKAMKYLTDCGQFDLNNLAMIAWKKQSLDCFIELINLDAKFPLNFKFDGLSTEIRRKLEGIVQLREAFHEDISEKSIEKVKQFIKDHPKLKNVYDLSNKTALTTALESSQFCIFSLLRYERFSNDDNFYIEAWNRLSYGDKSKITEANKNFFHSFKSDHLQQLLLKTRLSHGSRYQENENFIIIRRMYEELNKIAEIKPILEAAACAEKLEIVFDFTQPWIDDLDPTKVKGIRGASYHQVGYIYIGAEEYQEAFYEIIGTLIHEMTHFVMHLVYANNCSPFLFNDLKSKVKFESIVEETRRCDEEFRRFHLSDINISRVFRYDQRKWQAELIVRVPQIFACNGHDREDTGQKIVSLRARFSSLFHFYFEKTTKDIKSFIQLAQHKCLIREINSTASLLSILQSESLNYSVNRSISRCSGNKFNIIASNSSIMTLMSIFQSLQDVHKSHIFLGIETIFNTDLEAKVQSSFKSLVQPNVYIDCSYKFKQYQERLRKILPESDDRNRITIVVTHKELASVKSELHFENINVEYITHDWGELEDTYREELMKTQVNFQGCSVHLNQLLDKSSEVMKYLALNDLFQNDKLVVGDPVKDPNYDFYSEREFQAKTKENFLERKTFEEMMKLGEKRKSMIISGVAGTGKSSVMFSLAKTLKYKNPTYWVSLIDLKQHVDAFKQKVISGHEKFSEFIISTAFLNKREFDKKIFLEFYEKGKTITLLDGFDEISPIYNDLILSAVKAFDSKSQNQLWITTRSHLENELETSLERLACYISPMSEKETVEFMMKSWERVDSLYHRKEAFAKALVQKLSKISYSVQSEFGAPMLISMVAKIYEEKLTSDEDIENCIEDVSFYSIYVQYVRLFFKKWPMKGKLYQSDQDEINLSETSLQTIHQKIAIKHLFGDLQINFDLDFDQNDWTNEKLSRINIIQRGDVTQFHHETFAEFFVARFIVNNSRVRRETNDAMILMAHVLKRKECQIIRLFIDGAMKYEKTHDETQRKLLTKCLSDQLIDSNHEILEHVFSEKLESLASFLLSFVKGFEIVSIKKVIDHPKVLFLALKSGNISNVQETFKIISITEVDYQKLYLKKFSCEGENAFLSAAQNPCEGVLTMLMDFVTKIFTDETEIDIKAFLKHKDNENRNILHCVVLNENRNILQELLHVLQKYLSQVEISDFLLEKNAKGQNCFHETVELKNEAFVETFLTTFVSSLDDLAKKKIFNSLGKNNQNCLHLASLNSQKQGVLTHLLTFFKNTFEKSEFSQLVLQNNSMKSDVLLMLARSFSENRLNWFFELIIEFLSKDEIKSLFTTVDDEGDNCLQKAICFNSFQVIDSICEVLNIIDGKDDKIIVFSQNKLNGRSIFMCTSINYREETLRTFLRHVETIFNPDEVTKLLQQKSFDSRNIFHWFARRSNEKNLLQIFEVLKKYLSIDELKALILDEDSNGCNSFYTAVSFNLEIVESMVYIASSVLDENEMKIFLCNKREILLDAVANNTELKTVLSSVMKFTEHKFNKYLIKDLLMNHYFDGSNILHLAANYSGVEEIEELFSILRNYLGYDEIKDLIYEVNEDRNNFFHHAAKTSRSEEFEVIICNLIIFLDLEEQKKFFKQEGEFNESLFLIAASNNENDQVLKCLLTSVENIYSDEELKSLLSMTNNEDENILHLNQNGFSSSNFALEEILRKYFSDDEMKLFFKQKNKQGDNCFHKALRQSEISVCNDLCRVAVEIFKSDDELKHELKEFFKDCGANNENIFLCAAVNERKKDIFSILEENLTDKNSEELGVFAKNEIKSLLLQKNEDRLSILHLVLKNCDSEQLNATFDLLSKYLENFDFQTLLNEKDSFVDSFFHQAIAESSKEVINAICQNLLKIFDKSEQKNFFTSITDSGYSIFHSSAANRSSGDTFKILIEYMTKVFEKDAANETIKELCIRKTSKGVNILHLINGNDKTENNEIIFDALPKYLNAIEMKALINDENTNRDTCVHQALKLTNVRAFESLLNFISDNLNEDEQKCFFRRLGEKGQNIFLCAAMNKRNGAILKSLLKYVKNIYNKDEIKLMLQQKSIDEFNILMHEGKSWDRQALCEVFSIINEYFTSDDEIRTFLLQSNSLGMNCFLYATKSATRPMLSLLLQYLSTHLSLADEKVLYSSCDFSGNNCFHFASIVNPDIEIISELLIKFQKKFTKEEIKKLLERENEFSLRPYNALLMDHQSKVLEKVFQILTSFYDVEEIRSMLMDQVENKLNVLQTAAILTRNENIFKMFYDFSMRQRILSNEDFLTLLKNKDGEGKTALQLAIEFNKLIVCKHLWRLITKVFDSQGKKEQIIQLGREGINFVLDLIADEEIELENSLMEVLSFYENLKN